MFAEALLDAETPADPPIRLASATAAPVLTAEERAPLSVTPMSNWALMLAAANPEALMFLDSDALAEVWAVAVALAAITFCSDALADTETGALIAELRFFATPAEALAEAETLID
jgi:hypothetical protein